MIINGHILLWGGMGQYYPPIKMNNNDKRSDAEYLSVSNENPSIADSGKKNSFFLNGGVKERKDYKLKERLKALIKSKGMSEPDFFNKIQISRQLWYYYSWGVWPCPVHMRVKIAQALDTDSSVIFLEDCDIKSAYDLKMEGLR